MTVLNSKTMIPIGNRDNSVRVNKLRNLNILGTPKESEFESIAEIATYICDSPISMVTFLDEERQWFKAARGVGDLTEAPVETSFCIHTIYTDDGTLIVSDLKEDERFVNSPFVVNAPHMQFYAGMSITTTDGERIGTVCVMDVKPKVLSPKQIECLSLLAQYANKLVDLRRSNTELGEQNRDLATMNNDLKQYAYAIAHDIKAPLRIMSAFSNFLMKEAEHKMNEKELEYLNYILKSAKELGNYTQNLLRFSESTQVDTSQSQMVDLNELVNSLDELINKHKEISILYDKNLPTIFVSEIGLRQVLKNLIANSIRYRKKDIDNAFVRITVVEQNDEYHFKVADNGIGIAKEQLATIFELFIRDKMNAESTGIGLNVVERILNKMNGTISIASTDGEGTTVSFVLPRTLKFL
jgi:signal transduction histidine kinase